MCFILLYCNGHAVALPATRSRAGCMLQNFLNAAVARMRCGVDERPRQFQTTPPNFFLLFEKPRSFVDIHNSCKEPIPCGRECVAENGSEEARIRCLNYLKEWCLAGEVDVRRTQHTSWTHHPRTEVTPEDAATLDVRGDALLQRLRARSDLPHLRMWI